MKTKKQTKVTSQRKLTSSSVPEAVWYPHDIHLFEPDQILSDAIITSALKILKITDAERKAQFISRLRDIETTFRVERLAYDQPLLAEFSNSFHISFTILCSQKLAGSLHQQFVFNGLNGREALTIG